jgi:hypothetical protein
MGIFDRFFRKEAPQLSFGNLEAWCIEKEEHIRKAAEEELHSLLRKLDSKAAETR